MLDGGIEETRRGEGESVWLFFCDQARNGMLVFMEGRD